MARIASRAQGVVTASELRAAGLSRKEIEHRVRIGALIREHRGVYRVGHRAPSVEARYMAAVKAGGEGAALTGRAAAYLFGLVKGPTPAPEVAVPRRRRLPRADVTVWRGIPVTTVARTIVDLAADLPLEDLARVCHEAWVRYRVGPERVEAVLARRPNAKGAKRLRVVLRGDEPVILSELEKGLLKLLRDHGLPLPVTNRPASRRHVDCRWPGRRLTVELDSYAFHNSRHAFELDHRREREAYARGDQFRRYTWGDVFERPATVLDELQPLLTCEPGTMSSRPSGQRIQAL